MQVAIVWFAANGPFVDEALYAVAGMRVLEGKGPSHGYLTCSAPATLHVKFVRASGYAFQVEMAYRVARARSSIIELPIEFAQRERGASKMSLRIVLEALLLVTWWGWRDRHGRRLMVRQSVRARSTEEIMPTTSRRHTRSICGRPNSPYGRTNSVASSTR